MVKLRFQQPALAALLLALLAACGGGDDDEGGTTPVLTPQSPVGVFYGRPPGNNTTPMLAMVLPPNPAESNHVYYIAKQVSPLSTDYDGLIGSMSLTGAAFVSNDGRYSLSQENRMVGGINLTGTVTASTLSQPKTLTGRYTNPSPQQFGQTATLPISMAYQPNSYERPSSLTLIRGSYHSAGTYFGNSWQLQIAATTDASINSLSGSFNDGCEISGQLTAPDPARGLYQVTYLRLSGTKCDRDDEAFFGAATLTFNESGQKSGLWLMARHDHLNSGIKPVILVGDVSAAGETPILLPVESEGLWVGIDQAVGFKGVVLPNGQYFFYGADGSVLYGTFSSNQNDTLRSTDGVYRLVGGTAETGLTVVATSSTTGQMTLTFTSASRGQQTLTFATELTGTVGSPPLYQPAAVPPLAALVGSYQTSGGFGGSSGTVLTVAGDPASSNLLFSSTLTPTCEMTGSIGPYGTSDTNLYSVGLIYEGEGCLALQQQLKQTGVAVVTLNAAGGVSGLRVLAHGVSSVTGERLHTVYEGQR